MNNSPRHLSEWQRFLLPVWTLTAREIVRFFRQRTRIVVAFGDCAVTSNVVGLRNPLGGPDVVLRRAYVELADHRAGLPAEPGILPALTPRALPLHHVIPVDYFLPGCPPPSARIRALIEGLLNGTPQLSGSMLKFG